MRFGLVATNPIERAALAIGLVPRRPIRMLMAPGAGIQAAQRAVG